MKLLKITVPKNCTNTSVKGMCYVIFRKYPKADSSSVYATLIKNGLTASLSTVNGYKSNYDRETKIKAMMGVK